MEALTSVWQCINQFFRRTDEDATPMPEAAVKSYKKWCTSCLATAILAFGIAVFAYVNQGPSYFIGIGCLVGGLCLFIVIFNTFLLYFTWSKINRIVPHDSNSPETIQHPGGGGGGEGYGTINARQQRGGSENAEERPHPRAEDSEHSVSPASPEVASTGGSNEDASDQRLLVTAEINNEDLQNPDSETEAGFSLKLMECSTKSTEASKGPEVASTGGSNEDASDQRLLVTAEIYNEDLQNPDSETLDGFPLLQMECSTKRTEASKSTDKQSSEVATEISD